MKKKTSLVLAVFLLMVFLVTSLADGETTGMRRKKLKPHEYGSVVINNFSEKNKIAPVVFPHWLHRSKYTCRLCHVDIGFAMKAGETRITEDDVQNGLYCGTCHNGKIAFGPNEVNPLGGTGKNCERCHSEGKNVRVKNDFYVFMKTMPRDRFGNKIDWLKAEEQKLISLQDYIEGVSIKRKAMKPQEDFDLNAKVDQMPDIIFSHKKHAVWNGCELCHPDLFGVKRGSQPYSMQEIFQGKYCGACHDLVAFPNLDCQKCHSKPV